MQVIENATQLKARLRERHDDPDHPGGVRLTVEVTAAAPAGGLPSLVEAAAGDILAVRVPPAERAAVEGLAAGAAVTLQVRLRGPGVHTLVPGTLVAD
ncbi:hypothetical protein [Zoogloea sp.]|uniref:hypothetical protein n=1 Tax=Zoogloea sp. TaxID=49181 RepID=UPI0035AE9C65